GVRGGGRKWGRVTAIIRLKKGSRLAGLSSSLACSRPCGPTAAAAFYSHYRKRCRAPTKDDHFSIPPKILESIRRNPRVTHRAPDVALRAIGLWRSGCRG